MIWKQYHVCMVSEQHRISQVADWKASGNPVDVFWKNITHLLIFLQEMQLLPNDLF